MRNIIALVLVGAALAPWAIAFVAVVGVLFIPWLWSTVLLAIADKVKSH